MSFYERKNERMNFVYMMSNYTRTVLYTGSTSDIVSRVAEHKAQRISGFTQKYNAIYLVWYEVAQDMDAALLREKRIKSWKREWKDNLVTSMNPGRDDIYERLKTEMAAGVFV